MKKIIHISLFFCLPFNIIWAERGQQGPSSMAIIPYNHSNKQSLQDHTFPERQPHKTLYATLKINPDATISEISKAYKKQALATHPDKNQNNLLAGDNFKEVNSTYRILSDPKQRLSYDTSLIDQQIAQHEKKLESIAESIAKDSQPTLEFYNTNLTKVLSGKDNNEQVIKQQLHIIAQKYESEINTLNKKIDNLEEQKNRRAHVIDIAHSEAYEKKRSNLGSSTMSPWMKNRTLPRTKKTQSLNYNAYEGEVD